MMCNAAVFYEKKTYFPGELISGFVTLQVESVLAIESIVITVDRESGIKVEEIGDSLISDEKATRHLGRFVIYKEKTKKVFPGLHTFPFSFRMLPGEGSTVDYKKTTEERRVEIVNRYVSKCEVRIYGIYKPVAKVYKEIHITEAAEQQVHKNFFKQSISQCFCFRYSSIDVVLEIDSVLSAGHAHDLKVVAHNAEVSKVQASVDMFIESFCGGTPLIKLTTPCTVTPGKDGLKLQVDSSLPSSTARNEFFSVHYTINFCISIFGNGSTQIKKAVAIQSKKNLKKAAPSVIGASAISAPEKYLSLQC